MMKAKDDDRKEENGRDGIDALIGADAKDGNASSSMRIDEPLGWESARGPVTALRFSRRDRYVFAGIGPFLHTYDTKTGYLVNEERVLPRGSTIHGIRVHEDGLLAVFGGKRAALFRTERGRVAPIADMGTLEDWIMDVLIVDNNVVVGFANNYVCIYERKKDGIVAFVRRTWCSVRCLLYGMALLDLPSHHVRVASGTVFGELLLWEGTDASKPVRRLVGHRGSIFDVRWSRSGTYVCSVSDDRTVRLWTTTTDRDEDALMWTAFGHKARIWKCCFLDDDHVATSSQDATCKIWRLKDGKCVRTLSSHLNKNVWCVASDKVGTVLVSGGADGSIKIWDDLYDESRRDDVHVRLPSPKSAIDNTDVAIDNESSPLLKNNFVVSIKMMPALYPKRTRQPLVLLLSGLGHVWSYSTSRDGTDHDMFRKVVDVSDSVSMTPQSTSSRRSTSYSGMAVISNCTPPTHASREPRCPSRTSSDDTANQVTLLVAVGTCTGECVVVRVNCVPDRHGEPRFSTRQDVLCRWQAQRTPLQRIQFYRDATNGQTQIYTADDVGSLRIWHLNLDANKNDEEEEEEEISIRRPNLCANLRMSDGPGRHVAVCWSRHNHRSPQRRLITRRLLACGNQRGGIFLFDVVDDGVTSSEEIKPIHIVRRVHKRHPVNAVAWHVEEHGLTSRLGLFTCGQDGYVWYFIAVFDESTDLIALNAARVFRPTSVANIMRIWWQRDEEREIMYVAGYQGTEFVVKDHMTGTEFVRVPCKGFRRPWDMLCSRTNVLFMYAGAPTGKRVQRRRGSKKLSDRNEITTVRRRFPTAHYPAPFHGLRVMCVVPLALSPMHSEQRFLTGSDDGTIRIVVAPSLASSQKNAHARLGESRSRYEGHPSSVRTMCVVTSRGDDDRFVFSGGGESAVLVWRLSKDDDSLDCVCGVLGRDQLSSRTLGTVTKKKRKLKAASERASSEARRAQNVEQRVMSVSPIRCRDEASVLMTDSCGRLELLTVSRRVNVDVRSPSHSLAETWSHELRSVCSVSPVRRPALCSASASCEDDRCDLVTVGYSDGSVLLMLVAERKDDRRVSTRVLYSFQTHANGVNAIDIDVSRSTQDQLVVLVASGGDDGSVCLTMLTLNTTAFRYDVIVSHVYEWRALSACCITALCMDDAIIVAAGSEQRMFVLDVRVALDVMRRDVSGTRLTATDEDRRRSLLRTEMLNVTDVSALSIIKQPDSKQLTEGARGYLVIIAGDGVETFVM